MLGSCKLCKEVKDLQSSHVIPKLLYRYMRRYQDDRKKINGLLIVDARNRKIDVTQRQWKEYLFCRECEITLSKNETKFARVLHDVNSLEKDELKETCYSTDPRSIFSNFKEVHSDKSFEEFMGDFEKGYFNLENTEALKYFSASFVLRQLYLIEHNLAIKEVKMLEDYILGRGAGEFSLIVKLNTEKDYWTLCSSIPIDRLDDFKHYNFIVPNIWFHLIFDIGKKLSSPGVHIIPEEFNSNDVINGFISDAFKGIKVSDKANKAINKE